MRRALAIVAVAGLAAGCGHLTWTKPGSTEQDFIQDRGACQAQAYSVSQPQGMQTAMVFDGCMHSKGWRRGSR